MMPPRPAIGTEGNTVGASLLTGKVRGEAALSSLLRTDASAPILSCLTALFAAFLPRVTAFLTQLLCIKSLIAILRRVTALLTQLPGIQALLTILQGLAALRAPFLGSLPALLPRLRGLPALLPRLADIVLPHVPLASGGPGVFAPVLPGFTRAGAPVLPCLSGFRTSGLRLHGSGMCACRRASMRRRGAALMNRCARPGRAVRSSGRSWRGSMRGGAWRMSGSGVATAVLVARCRVNRLYQRGRRNHGSRCEDLFEHHIVPQIRRPPRTHQVDG
jgi:hypothetical protein